VKTLLVANALKKKRGNDMSDVILGESIALHLDGDGCWPDLKEKGWLRGKITSVAAMPQGTNEGNPSVTIRGELEDGRVVLLETTMRLFNTCTSAFRGRFGDLP